MATRFQWFKTVSENYSKPVLENKRLTLLIWALFLPLAGSQVIDWADVMFPPKPVVDVKPTAPVKQEFLLKGHGHSGVEVKVQKNTNSIEELKILHR